MVAGFTNSKGGQPRDNSGAPVPGPARWNNDNANEAGALPAPGGIVSPHTTVDAAAVQVSVPAWCTHIEMRPQLADIVVGDNATLDGSGVAKGYFVVPAGTREIVPVGHLSDLWFKRLAGTDSAVSFFFLKV